MATAERKAGWVLLLLAAGLVAAKILAALQMLGPVVWGDAILYLSRARNLVETGWPVLDNLCGPEYPPLYSLVLALAYLPGWGTAEAYRWVLVLNALLSTAALGPSYLLSRGLSDRRDTALLATALVGVHSVTFAYSLTVLAENLFVPLITAWFLVALWWSRDSGRGSLGLAAGLLGAACLLTKASAVGLVPAFACLGGVGLLRLFRAGDRRAGLAVVLFLLGLTGPWLLWRGWWLLSLPHATIPLEWRGFYPVDRYHQVIVGALTSGREAVLFLRLVAKQLAYLLFSTWGLAGVALVGTAWLAWFQHRDRSFHLVVLAGVGGMLVTSVVHCAAYYDTDPERYSLFGRYVDPLVPLLLVLGSVVLAERHMPRRWLISSWSVFAVTAAVVIPWPARFGFHRVGLSYLYPFRDLLPYRLLVFGLVGTILVILLVWKWRAVRGTAPLVAGLVFCLATGVAVVSAWKASLWFREYHPVALHLARYFDPRRDCWFLLGEELQRSGCLQEDLWLLLYANDSPPQILSRERPFPRRPCRRRFLFTTTPRGGQLQILRSERFLVYLLVQPVWP
ncbi:MAG: hypothetical protein Kow00109_22770 [Acidobacteriota bacterium]